MTIKVFPSRISVEPLETHQHSQMTIHEWMRQNVSEYRQDMPQRVFFVVNGQQISAERWDKFHILPDDDIAVYPIPGEALSAAAIIAIVSAVVAVGAVVYSIVMMQQMKDGMGNTASGDQLELSPAKANTARLGDPIREIFGRFRVYPDYVVPPVSRFDVDNPRIYRTNMLLCVGAGDIEFGLSGIRIGNTPAASLGGDFSYALYPPGSDLSADARSEIWYTSTEVGNTTSGGAGIDLNSTGPTTTLLNADSIFVSGNTVTAVSDADDAVPEEWGEGKIIYITAPDDYVIKTEDGYSVVYGRLEELSLTPGLEVSVTMGGDKYQLVVDRYTPAVPDVPGVGGHAASIAASDEPETFDFRDVPVEFTVIWVGNSYVVTLNDNYQTLSTLCAAISSKLSGSGLVARSQSGKVIITESSVVYAGGVISHSTLPEEIFGESPVTTDGQASQGGVPGTPASARFTTVSEKPFVGAPEGAFRLAISTRDFRFRITDVDGATITVERMIADVVDDDWTGFRERALLDAVVKGSGNATTWAGPFLACPEGETTEAIEFNFVFPGGIAYIHSSGKVGGHWTGVRVQYRDITGGDWKEVVWGLEMATLDEVGMTKRLNVPRGNYEVRVRRDSPPEGTKTRDNLNWQAMRSLLQKRPSKYENVTLLAITVRTGNRLAAQSDRRISVTGTRKYSSGGDRTISGALYHVADSLGIEIDRATVNALESAYWTPDGETFDYATDDSSSALEILQKIASAGKSNFLLNKNGLASISRDGIKPWVGAITPHEMTEDLQTDFTAPSEDDYDGVDVTYVDPLTWTEETVQCRLPGNPTPIKVEDYKLEYALSADRAYQLGMRRLMKYQKQRLVHKTSTELDALCYDFDDHIVISDDIPGSNTISCLIVDAVTAGGITTFTVSEPLDWSFENPRAIIRYQDGSASRLLLVTEISDYQLAIEHVPEFDDIITGDPFIEPPRLLFCSSERSFYHAIVTDISPGDDGTCDVTAVQYSERFYDYDNATYPGDVS